MFVCIVNLIYLFFNLQIEVLINIKYYHIIVIQYSEKLCIK